MNRIALAALALFTGFAFAQPGDAALPTPAALAGAERVEVKGVVERMDAAPGQGFPTMVVKTSHGPVRVQLGSLRFLIEQDFNPQAGAEVVVQGFRWKQDVVARTVELPARKKTLALRTEDGKPLWRMGRYGKRNR